ncbi:vascular cell adhesion protein 1-like [Trachinotus anak]|uniref:vascular cell adhesion protein 1-like n=1 Tax=Trachinotus anak TaxID=443729 RepID=UPI0039F1BE13
MFFVLLVVSWMSTLCDFHVSSCEHCADEPVFTPSRLVVKYGDPTSALCSVCPSCADSVFDLEKALGDITKNGTTVLWRVESMTEWDTIVMCYYDDANGTQCCSNLPLTVYKPPDHVSISFVNHTGPMFEGHHYTLRCEVQDVAPIENLIVTFYRGRTALGQLQSNNTKKTPVTETFSMDIIPGKEDDGVQYWCEAKLQLGPEGPQHPLVMSDRATATVYYKPQKGGLSHPDPISITEGESLSLNCSAVGNPSPSYTWTLPSASRPHSNSNPLVIHSVTSKEEGQYTCLASNDLGRINVTFNVVVKQFLSNGDVRLEIHLSQSFCSGRGPAEAFAFSIRRSPAVPGLTRFDLRAALRRETMFFCYMLAVVSLTGFLRDSRASGCEHCADEPVFTPSRLVVKYGDPTSALCSVCPSCADSVFDLEKALGDITKNGTTVLWRVESMTEWDTTVMCYYDDANGTQCCSNLPLTVYKLPDHVSISFVNHTGPILVGKHYTLRCEVQDVAPIENLIVTFYRGRTALGQLQSNNTKKTPVTETFSMDIIPGKEDDGVQFWCEAKLQLGPEGPQHPLVMSDRATATVYYKPQLEGPSDPDPITITEGGRLQLSCKAEGNPSPLHTWRVLPAVFPPMDSSVLTIESVGFEHGGQYICDVTNGVGKSTVMYTVTVKTNYIPYIVAAAVAGVLLFFAIIIIAVLKYYKHNRMGQYNLKDVFRLHTHVAVPITE